MRKTCVVALVAVLAVALAAPALAQTSGDKKWNIHGSVRARADYFENYDFFDAADDDASIWPYTVRVGIDGTITDNVKAMVEFRTDGTFGSAPTFNEFGGSPQFFTSNYSSQDNVNLYQGYVDLEKLFGWESFTARIGRQEMTLGTELLMGDNDFYTGQSFDGARLMWMNDKWDLNLFYFKINENNFNNGLGLGYGGQSADTNFFGGNFDWKLDKWGQLDFYWLRYQGLDDSTGSSIVPGTGIDTYGARWGKTNTSKDDGWFDWNLEYATQSGDYGNGPGATDISSDVIEGWFGVNFHPGDSHHRFHLGVLQASGDDPSTLDDETFFPLFGDGHAHNRVGNLDSSYTGQFFGVSNVQDVNFGYTGRFADGKHTFMAAVHKVSLDEPIVAGGEDDLGMVWDVNYMYQWSDHVGFEVNLSQGQPGDLQDLLVGGSADSASRYYGQMVVRW